MSPFSKLLFNRRTALNLSPKELSIRANIDPSLVSRYEGSKRTATRSHVIALANALLSDKDEFLQSWWQSRILDDLKEEDPALIQAIISGLQQAYTTEPAISADFSEEGNQHLEEFRRLNKLWQAKKHLYPEQQQAWNNHDEMQFICKSCVLSGNKLSTEEAWQVLNEGVTIGGKTFNDHLQLLNYYEAWQMLKRKMNDESGLSLKFLKQVQEKLEKGIIHSADASKAKPGVQELLNRVNEKPGNTKLAQEAIAIHAGFMNDSDKGRLARLLTNFFMLKNGFPVIIFSSGKRSRQQLEEALNASKKEKENHFAISVLEGINSSVKKRIELMEA